MAEDSYKCSIVVVTAFNHTAMALGKSIRIYLADATVTGIRYVELVNWTGLALARLAHSR